MAVVQRTKTTFNASGTVETIENIIVKRLPKEGDFVKVYSGNIHLLRGLFKEREVLDCLLAVMDYECTVHLNPSLKKTICYELGIFKQDGRGSGRELLRDAEDNPIPSLDSLNVYISRLAKKGILLHKGTSTYMVNPFLFAKGLWSDVKKLQQKVAHLFNITEEE